MVTKEQKMDIRKLREEGFNKTQIAKKMKLDWKTVDREEKLQAFVNNQKPNDKKNPRDDLVQGDDDFERMIFRRLNDRVSPREVIAEFGHADLFIELYTKWKALDGYKTANFGLSDPKIAKTFDAWQRSIEKHLDWHQKRIIYAIGEGAYLRMENYQNHKNRDVECPQLYGTDPYWCISCLGYKFDI
jgi:IS30 family transposase